MLSSHMWLLVTVLAQIEDIIIISGNSILKNFGSLLDLLQNNKSVKEVSPNFLVRRKNQSSTSEAREWGALFRNGDRDKSQ